MAKQPIKKDALGRRRLTEHEKRFITEYVMSHDAREAYKAAGYTHHFSKKQVERKLIALEPWLREALTAQALVVAQQAAVTSEEIIAHFGALARFNYLDFMVHDAEFGWRWRRFEELTREQCGIVCNVTINAENGKVSYGVPGTDRKDAAARLMGQHLGVFLDSVIEQNLHLHKHTNVQLGHLSDEEIKRLESEFARAVGPQLARQVLGWTHTGEQEDADAQPL